MPVSFELKKEQSHTMVGHSQFHNERDATSHQIGSIGVAAIVRMGCTIFFQPKTNVTVQFLTDFRN
jgi:hypothetical protein